MRVTLPKTTYPRIVERFVSLNHTVKQLAHEHGVGITTVYGILRRSGVNVRETQKNNTISRTKSEKEKRRVMRKWK